MNDSSAALVQARGLRKDYGSGDGLVRAIDTVDLDVGRGETVSGQRVDELTAQENVELPALLAGCTPGEARVRATALLEQVGLADRARHLPSMPSGGQRQRVAIARALANDPEIVLADEPAGNLDSAAAFDVLSLLEGLHANGLTVVIVTHDERIATTADRLISMREPEADLVGVPGAPPLTLITIVVALVVSLAVALASTLVPAIRAARMSTVGALADVPRLPKRRDSLIRLSRKLPVPALFGLRLVARRPRRAILSAASIAVTVMGLVAALAIHAAVDQKFSQLGGSGGLVNPDVPRAEQVLTAITILLVVLAALTAIFAALATVLDARRASAVTLALGATPQQVRAGLVMGQVIPALPGAILGLPLGIGLFKVAGHGLSGWPPLWLAAAVLGTVLVVAALTTVPARIGLRRPVAEMLQAEAA
jgi:energy-coupling factor transporter ATP-binding protein EcfA2